MGVRTAERGVECGVWSVECAVLCVVRCVCVCGMLCVVCCVVCGVWCVVYGLCVCVAGPAKDLTVSARLASLLAHNAGSQV